MRINIKATLILFVLSAILMVIALLSGEVALVLSLLSVFGFMLSAALFLVWLVVKTVPKVYAWRTTKSGRIKIYILVTIVISFVFLTRQAFLFFHGTPDKEGWTTYTGQYSISALAVDKEGRVWAAHYNSTKLFPWDGDPVQIPLNAEMADDSVFSLAIDGENRIWAGTFNGLVCMWDDSGKWTIYTPENPKDDNRVRDIGIDAQGRAWVRSNSGLGMIDSSEGKTTYTFQNSGLPNNNVHALTVDQQGRVWVINDGVVKVLESNGEWTQYATLDGSQLAIDAQGRVWVGKYQTVIVSGRNGIGQTEYTLGDTSIANYMNDIVVDNKGRVWVASSHQGLFMFDPIADTGWTTYNERNSGLTNDSPNSLCIDGQGRLWIGSNALSIFDIEATLSPKR